MKNIMRNKKAKNMQDSETENTLIVSEPRGMYGSTLNFNPLYFRRKIQDGVSFDFYNKLSTQLEFSEENWADILSLSTKSLQRYSKEKEFKFKPIHSEKLLEIAEVVDLGKSILGNLANFNIWMNTPNLALGNLKPKELITDSYGKQMLIDELNRIEHGIFV
ncbi:MAG TPA: DUF2384 domain-containing protein [Chitinophagales bacterium]|nr:DUF2384 domain-containing protein [Chitinophagales bacterium]HNL84732.1 DUF2384 domain-containing protein [Chitinophagales bacterium]